MFPIVQSARVGGLAFVVAMCGSGRPATAAAVGDVTLTVNGSEARLSSGADRIFVSAVAPEILRVDYRPGGRESPATLVLDPAWRPQVVPAAFVASGDAASIRTESMTVRVDLRPFRITVSTEGGAEPLLTLPTGGLEPDRVRFTHAAGEKFYGITSLEIPERERDPKQAIAHGLFRNRGGRVDASRQGDGGAPFVFTTRYGLVFDSDGGDFDITDDTLSFSQASRSGLRFFVVVGPPRTVMRHLAALSGPTPMFPKWALGFLNSEWGTDQAEVEHLVATYRRKRIPLDGFILDFDWKAWGADGYGEWRWNPDHFPDGASGAFAARLAEAGVRLVGIWKPRLVLEGTGGGWHEAARHAETHGFWIPGQAAYEDYFAKRPAKDLDFSIPDVRAWFWEHARPAVRAGIAGYWNDEADGNGHMSFPTFQGLNMQRAFYEGQRADGDRRVFSLNRNFYLGAQRHAYGLWSGDIPTGFASMAAERVRMLTSVNIGALKWSMDVGGFEGTPTPEVYARWMQFGAFVPLYRVHGTLNQQRQPWAYGRKAEAVAAAAIRLRRRLLPYIYSYEHQAVASGVGIVRPLFYDFPRDPAAANVTDAWMFGDGLLVAPVVDAGQTEKAVYLPEGTWIDFFRGGTIRGGRTITYRVDARSWRDIPLFVRRGAIIPSQEAGDIAIDVFPDTRETRFVYYDDDGESYAYERGHFFSQEIAVAADAQATRIAIGPPRGTFSPPVREVLLRVHAPRARAVSIDGVPARRWSTGRDRYGDVTFVRVAAGVARKIELRR